MEWKFFLLICGMAAATNSRNSDDFQRALDFGQASILQYEAFVAQMWQQFGYVPTLNTICVPRAYKTPVSTQQTPLNVHETQQWQQSAGTPTQAQGRTNQGAVSAEENYNIRNTGGGPITPGQTINRNTGTFTPTQSQGSVPTDPYYNTQNAVPVQGGRPSHGPVPTDAYQNTQTQFQTNGINAKQNTHEKFNTKLFQLLGSVNGNRNVVYSPISLQTLLAFIYMGAHDLTAHELQKALELPADKREVAAIFQNLLASQKVNRQTQTIMANRLYYSTNLIAEQEISNLGKSSFDAELQQTNFAAPLQAAGDINAWVAAKTNNLIQNIIDPYSLDARTAAILVNAIYFKAKWEKEFSTDDTQKYDFHTGPQRKVLVDMMYNDDAFRYGELPDLQARVIELPYNNTDMSMMIILPNELNGLQAVERRLQNVDLNQVSARLKTEAVTVRIPKFRIEYQLDMMEPLKQLGVKRLFNANAELQGFFGPNQPVGISKILHKAFIDVNEAGTEAAAASFAKFIPLSLPPKLNLFTADHPFMFAIRSSRAVYFAGHVVNFNN